MIRTGLEPYTWDSQAMLAADLAPDGTVLHANAALERLAGGPLAGRAFEELIAEAQRDAFEERLASAGPGWSSANFSFSPGGAAIADRPLRVDAPSAGDSVLVVAEPAVGEQERLVEKVLELNDELVDAHRALVRQREELRAVSERVGHLEAISAAGLSNLRLDDLLDAVLRLIADAVRAPRAVLLLRDEDELVARAAVGVEGVDARRHPRADGRRRRGLDRGRRRAAARRRPVQDRGPQRLPARVLALDGGRPVALHDEVIGVLHVSADDLDHFGEDDLALLEPAAERAALAIGRARVLERERGIAETLQRSLLPDVLPDVEGLELRARFTPGAGVDVGGDWYDALPLPDGRLAVVIGDVAGKGLRAAVMMGELRAGLRAYAIEGGGAIETLARLELLAERSAHMATLVLMLIDPATGRAEFGSAGHLPPLLLDAGGRARFLSGGASAPLLAFHDDVPAQTLALEPGDRIVLYTDGLVERRSEVIDDGLERLRLAAEGFGGGLDALCEHLMDCHAPRPRGRRRTTSRSSRSRAPRARPSARAASPARRCRRSSRSPGLAVEREAGHARGEEGERLLQLRAGQVRAQAVVHAGAEGQRLRAAAVGGDVEARSVDAVAVAGERAHEHDGPLGEGDVAVGDVLDRDPRGERRDRLEAHDLLDRLRRQQRVLRRAAPTARGARRTAAARARAGSASCRRRRRAR